MSEVPRQIRQNSSVTPGEPVSNDEEGCRLPSHAFRLSRPSHPLPSQSTQLLRCRTYPGRLSDGSNPPQEATESPSALGRPEVPVGEPSHHTSRSNSHSTDQSGPDTTTPQDAMATPTALGEPEVLVGEPPIIWRQWRNILFASRMNFLLFAIPVSWALHFAVPERFTLVFIFSFLAIIPLAKLLSFATEQLSLGVGETWAGFVSTTLGNIVEMVIVIFALVRCDLHVIQSSLVGSIMGNLLLVLGLCFFVGGTRFSEQGFATRVAQINSYLLVLSVTSVLVPAVFNVAARNGQISGLDNEAEQRDILKLSHGVALVLLPIYVSYLIFQFYSHKSLCDSRAQPRPETVRYPLRRDAEQQPEEERGETKPELSMRMAVTLLCVVKVLIGVTAECLLGSINGLASGKISKEFFSFILIPIVGNVAEYTATIMASRKDKLTLSLSVAIGGSVQMALCIIPLTVISGWMTHRPITMLFDTFESIVLFLSVSAANHIAQHGRSEWLQGMVLIGLYVIVAVVVWFYHGTEPTGLLTCS